MFSCFRADGHWDECDRKEGLELTCHFICFLISLFIIEAILAAESATFCSGQSSICGAGAAAVGLALGLKTWAQDAVAGLGLVAPCLTSASSWVREATWDLLVGTGGCR